MALHIDSRDGERVTASAWYPRLARGVSRFEGSIARDGRITLREVEVVYGHYKTTQGGISAGARFEAEIKGGVLRAKGTMIDEQNGAERSVTFSVSQAGAAVTNSARAAKDTKSPTSTQRYVKTIFPGAVFRGSWIDENQATGSGAFVITARDGARFEGLEFTPMGKGPYFLAEFKGEIKSNGDVTRERGRVLNGNVPRQTLSTVGRIERDVWQSSYVWTNEDQNVVVKGQDTLTLVK